MTGTFSSDLSAKPVRRTYAGVDVFKFFFAVCIVALHTDALDFLPYNTFYMITNIVFRAAVPYFFVASGFFLGRKLLAAPGEQYARIIRAYCLRLLKPLIFFEIISLVYHGFVFLYTGKGLVYTVLNLVRSILFYPYGALWYVQACIVGALLLYPFLKRDRLKLAVVIGIPLYGFALIANNYSFLIRETPLQDLVALYLKCCDSARNGLFTGFLFLALGILCSKVHHSTSGKIHPGLLLLSFALYLAEIRFIYAVNPSPLDDGALYISHLFFIPALFLATLRLDLPVSAKTAELFRNLSTGVYFLHRPVLYLSGYVISAGWLNFLIVLGCSVVICLVSYKTRLKPLYTLLR